MKNILKEIKNDIISKGDEPRVDNIEQYISQNKIFCLLFYSDIIPEYLNILSSLKIINNNDNLKLIVCICEDSEEDYNKTISKMNDISCLILNYNSKNKDFLINNYNIISLPKLIVLNKDGQVIDNLNSQRIQILNENDIQGWKNKFIIPNLYKNKVPELGDRGQITNHQHELIFSNYSMKSGYGKGGWICDICRKSFEYNFPNFYCSLCGFDVCDVCYNKYKCN
jgi:hypothetical protein